MLIEQINKFESENNVFSISVKGYKFWQYIRWDLIQYIDNLNGSGPVNYSASKGSKSKEFIKRLHKSIFKTNKYIQTDVLFTSSGRTEMFEGHMIDPYLYGIIKELNKSHSSSILLNPDSNDYCAYNGLVNNVLSPNIFLTIASIISTMKRTLSNDKTDQLVFETCKETIIKLMNYLDINNFEETKVNSICKKAVNYRLYVSCLKKEYIILLKRIQPRCLVELCSYSLDHLVLNEAAKDLNIIIIELQHGIMGLGHFAYNFNGKGPDGFPDVLLVFSDYWKETIKPPLNKCNIISTGSPFMEMMSQVYPKHNNEDKIILFVSQPTVGKELSTFAANVAQLIKKKNINCKIIYKLHPREKELSETYTELLKSQNIHVVCKEENIYHLLANANIVIGCYSTSLYEATHYPVKILIYRTFGAERMYTFARDGYATFITTCDEVIDIIDNNDKPTVADELFWKKNAIKNIVHQIDKCLNNV